MQGAFSATPTTLRTITTPTGAISRPLEDDMDAIDRLFEENPHAVERLLDEVLCGLERNQQKNFQKSTMSRLTYGITAIRLVGVGGNDAHTGDDMNTEIKNQIAALNLNVTFDGDMYFEGAGFLISECDDDDRRLTICDTDGYPVADVALKDAESVIGRLGIYESADLWFSWLREWAAAGGWDVKAA
jgi:hypothetical protein